VLEHLLRGRHAEALEQRAELLQRQRADGSQVARLEAAVAKSPSSALSFDADGGAMLKADDHRYGAGRFAVRSIRQLRAEAHAHGVTGHKARLSVLVGQDPMTDIGALQATAAPSTLFQVASQFNCLEAPGPGIVPVADYFGDSTQGPRASISAFPGTLLHHYAAPASDGTRFTQTEERQLNLLSEALPRDLARVSSGYLMSQHIADAHGAASTLEERFEDICVGVHDDVQVVLGHNWDGGVEGDIRIAQVFTSTLALGYSRGSRESRPLAAICRHFLAAAYLGTILAGSALGKRTVVLTLIGGGVFANPHPLIWSCIEWALEEADPILAGPLDVVVNCRDIQRELVPALAAATRARGGACLEVERGRISVMD
jgi:hypothetical protein